MLPLLGSHRQWLYSKCIPTTNVELEPWRSVSKLVGSSRNQFESVGRASFTRSRPHGRGSLESTKPEVVLSVHVGSILWERHSSDQVSYEDHWGREKISSAVRCVLMIQQPRGLSSPRPRSFHIHPASIRQRRSKPIEAMPKEPAIPHSADLNITF